MNSNPVQICSCQLRVKIWIQVTETNESTPSWCLWHHPTVRVHRTAEVAFSFTSSAIMMDVYISSLRANYFAFVWGPRITCVACLHKASFTKPQLDAAEQIAFSTPVVREYFAFIFFSKMKVMMDICWCLRKMS